MITPGNNYDVYQRSFEMVDLAIKSDSSCKNWAEFPKDVDSPIITCAPPQMTTVSSITPPVAASKSLGSSAQFLQLLSLLMAKSIISEVL